MATLTADIDRIQALGTARNTAVQALGDIDRELRELCITAIRFGCASALIAQFAGIPRTKLDRWIDEERESERGF